MLKISALNEELDDESGSEEDVTREALEQIAIQQYGKALELLRKGDSEDALQLLKDLLDTELLDSIRKPEPGEKVVSPLLNLKYLSCKNIATILAKLDKKEDAIEAYIEASLLDDTDVTLWNRLGLLCIETDKFELALQAFQRGLVCNRRHWPCIDKVITLLFGLGHYNECLEQINSAFELDPYYMRGLVYKKYIYNNLSYVYNYMICKDKKFAYTTDYENEINEKISEVLLKEAETINDKYRAIVKENTFTFKVPTLKLKRSFTEFSWVNLCQSIVDMHKHMTENCYSHAAVLELMYDVDCASESQAEEITSVEALSPEKECESKDENVEDEAVEKVEQNNEKQSDVFQETLPSEADESGQAENEQKKNRRRGSELSILEPWEWYHKRKSNRKKAVEAVCTKPAKDATLYDVLKRILPTSLIPNDSKDSAKDDESLETTNLDKKIEENLKKLPICPTYFGSKAEKDDVKWFIETHNESKCDIITILKDILEILSLKWETKFPDKLIRLYIECNICAHEHFDKPSIGEENYSKLSKYAYVNLLAEEFVILEKLSRELKEAHSIETLQYLEMFMSNPLVFPKDGLSIYVRFLWYKCNLYILNDSHDLALECLYQLSLQFEAMGDGGKLFHIELPNFSNHSVISRQEVQNKIEMLERNKKLSNVMPLYELGNLEDALQILNNTFNVCKELACKGKYEEMTLDWAVQLLLILDCHWGVGDAESCFKWASICLHESFKHYLKTKYVARDSEKWELTVSKCLICIEHIIKTNTNFLENLEQKQKIELVEDLLQIIGEQINKANTTELPFKTVTPWIILHFIMQKEEDFGREKKFHYVEKGSNDEIPNALTVLFIGHDQIGKRGWCHYSDYALLYFILDTIMPRFRSPALARAMDLISLYLEQCIFCLYGHPSKKTKLKYLEDHNVSPQSLDWTRAQQLYEVFRPADLPEIEGKIPSISADTEQLFQRILEFMPEEYHPKKHVTEMIKYIQGKSSSLPIVQSLLPYRIKDIFYILGDYYFKKEEIGKSIKYNLYDVIVNSDRLESWAELALAKVANSEAKLRFCEEITNDIDFIAEVEAAERCFKRTLDIDSAFSITWVEYGAFAYSMHSYCSRSLKQASESLSMEDFEKLEMKKELMLETANKYFNLSLNQAIDHMNESDAEDTHVEEIWFQYYVLGKIAEKRTKSPSVYINYYMKAAEVLQENKAQYPSKINYNTPQHLSIQAMEIQYRIHSSILKYVEQHENKIIPKSEAKLFLSALQECANGPFYKKKKNAEPNEEEQEAVVIPSGIKRSNSENGDESIESKRTKFDTIAPARRASVGDISPNKQTNSENKTLDENISPSIPSELPNSNNEKNDKEMKETEPLITHDTATLTDVGPIECDKESHAVDSDERRPSQDYGRTSTTATSASSSSSDSSDSSNDSDSEKEDVKEADAALEDNKPADENDISQIIDYCLDALEDCVSRFSQHYKALFRLAHYYFYYKKGKNMEKCRNLMLYSFVTRSGQKLQGLFSERKSSNFFNNIWRIPVQEIDRAGNFAFHISRCVLLTMEILKEIDDHKTLLEMSMYLQKTPEAEKKCLKDSERKELCQQAYTLSVQSLKGQLMKFAQQEDLKSSEIEMTAFNSLMLDIYRAYQKVQKLPNAKLFTNLLVEGFKMCSTALPDNANLVDLSMKYCQALIASLKQQASMARKEQKQEANRTNAKPTEPVKPQPVVPTSKPKPTVADKPQPPPHKMSPSELSAALQSFLPSMSLSDPLLTQQTVAALSLQRSLCMTQLGTLQSTYAALQNTLQTSLQNSFQSEFCRQYLSGNLIPKPAKPKKSKSASSTTKSVSSKPIYINSNMSNNKTIKAAKPTSQTNTSSNIKVPGVSSGFSKTPSIAPNYADAVAFSKSASFDSYLKPAHMPTAAHTYTSVASSTSVKPAHQNTSTTVSAAIQAKPPLPHEQVSPGKTLQEKLAEKQKMVNKISSNGESSDRSKIEDAKRALGFASAPPNRPAVPMDTDEIIVLDDD